MKSLLIVIEEEYLSKGIALGLMNDYQSIHTTKNPYEAIEILKKDNINAIISEVKFSTISVKKYLSSLEKDSKKATKIIILYEDQNQDFIKSEKFIFIQKPIAILNIIETLKSNSKTKIN